MNSQFARLILFGLATAFLASADELTFSLSSTGSFSSGTPTDLSFTGIGSTSVAGFTATTVGGALSLTDLGTFTVQKPSQGADNYAFPDTFTLNLIFFQPVGIGSSTTFTAALTGTVNTQQGSVNIDFGPAKTFTFLNPEASGGFDLAINDLTLSLPHDSTTSVSQVLQGRISNAYDPVSETAPVPEPVSIVLLGSATLLIAAKHRRRTSKS